MTENIVQFTSKDDYPTIKKTVDGEVIEAVDIDSLTEGQFRKFCRDTGTEWFQRLNARL